MKSKLHPRWPRKLRKDVDDYPQTSKNNYTNGYVAPDEMMRIFSN